MMEQRFAELLLDLAGHVESLKVCGRTRVVREKV